MRAIRALTNIIVIIIVVILGAAEPTLPAGAVLAQEPMHPAGHTQASTQHEMLRVTLGRGWSLTGMAQVFPVVTAGAPFADEGDPLRRTGWYLTQAALMANLAAPAQRLVLRTTLNLEGITQPEGELTFGGWGEGFLDKRHPHTLLHELMLSVNAWELGNSRVSLSAGRGFAPYGTDDPMSRPALKYPTNHHLSQVLERWTLNAVWRTGGWSLEAGLFGGAEPEGPYDLSGLDTFGDSWSARLARRWGSEPTGPAWEASTSYARLAEARETGERTTRLVNAALRHSGPAGPGLLYVLIEGSRSDPEPEDGYFSLLGEARYEVSRHEPHLRVEYATRPEYPREGPPGTDEFFRYDHHAEPVGATRWLVGTAGYGYRLTGYPASLRPFVEIQHHRVRPERGGVLPGDVLGSESFWAVSVGVRVFVGGGPMRMGSYGVLDPMTEMSRAMTRGMAGMGGM
jgi:hypothetical protein